MFREPPTPAPHHPVPPPSPAELIGMALTREEEAEHWMRQGLHQEARRHWKIANEHRRKAAGGAAS